MNERIVETPLGNVLLYRDITAGEQDQVIVRGWHPNGSVVASTIIDISSPERAQQLIQEYTPEQATKFIQFVVTPFSK
ncbi:hypothetical protein [Fibrivirga algicola]|uniref:Uncharacterized protein n=1 Tax=Fibrivirga algicola TaxID=2950420 RepID=A0ABX0QNM3_9BACT|nr:hypothetical protein [Fibrivirga algicola]NID13756.1 hypothetical protein [Fibrivirga algicola]